MCSFKAPKNFSKFDRLRKRQRIGIVLLIFLLLLIPLQILGIVPSIYGVSVFSGDAQALADDVGLDVVVMIRYTDRIVDYVKGSVAPLEMFAPSGYRKVPVARVDCTFSVSVQSRIPQTVELILSSERRVGGVFDEKSENYTVTLDEMKRYDIITVGMSPVSPVDLFPNGNLTSIGSKQVVDWKLTVEAFYLGEGRSVVESGEASFTGYWRDSSYADYSSTSVSSQSNLIQIPNQLILQVIPNVAFTGSRQTFYMTFITYPELQENVAVPVNIVGCGFNVSVSSNDFVDGTAMVTLTPNITGNLSFIYPAFGKYAPYSPMTVPVFKGGVGSFGVSPNIIHAGEMSNLTVTPSPEASGGYLKMYDAGIETVDGWLNESLTIPVLPAEEGIISFLFKSEGFADSYVYVKVLSEVPQPFMIATPNRITAFYTAQAGGFTTIIHFSPAQYPYVMYATSLTFDVPRNPQSDSSMHPDNYYEDYSLLKGWSPAVGTGAITLMMGWYPVPSSYQFDPVAGELLAIYCGYNFISPWQYYWEKQPSTALGWWDLSNPHQFRRAFNIPETPSQWTVNAMNQRNLGGGYVDFKGEHVFNEDGTWGDAESHVWYVPDDHWAPVKQIYAGYETINAGSYSAPAMKSAYHGEQQPGRGTLHVSSQYPNSSIPILLGINSQFINLWNEGHSNVKNQDNYVHIIMRNGQLQHSVALKVDPFLDSYSCYGRTVISGGEPSEFDEPQGGYIANPEAVAGGSPTDKGGQRWLNLFDSSTSDMFYFKIVTGYGLIAIGFGYFVLLGLSLFLIFYSKKGKRKIDF